jgi:hypothetical protein
MKIDAVYLYSAPSQKTESEFVNLSSDINQRHLYFVVAGTGD